MKKKNLVRKVQEDRCPRCGGELEYGSGEPDCGMYIYETSCKDCTYSGGTAYKMQFVSHYDTETDKMYKKGQVIKPVTGMQYFPVRFKLFKGDRLLYDSRDTDYVYAKTLGQARKLAMAYMQEWWTEWTDEQWTDEKIVYGKPSKNKPKEFELIIQK